MRKAIPLSIALLNVLVCGFVSWSVFVHGFGINEQAASDYLLENHPFPLDAVSAAFSDGAEAVVSLYTKLLLLMLALSVVNVFTIVWIAKKS